MIWIWLGVVVSLLLIEYMSRNFTAICFAISGIVSCILTHYHKTYKTQLTCFLIIGIFLILIIRPQVLKWIEKRKQKKNEELKKENKSRKEKRKQSKKAKKKK